MGELGCGGVLALDEVEWIRTDNAAFRRYLKLVGALLSVRGSTLVTGPIIERFDGGPHGRKRTSEVRILPLPRSPWRRPADSRLIREEAGAGSSYRERGSPARPRSV